ncbi:MAG: imidazole glycerol phosphate synthase subunit HisH [Thermoproteota archaeon]|nr:imidazole glycerol phosphate synthase subunit HisH [Candidatus Brockarchaeota archaeon]MBO3802025.1 imidazole glycerol phosphate synthase subunit HisH [Candidatus Brockarchaeota archaeon]
MLVALVDTGVSNLTSLTNALSRLGASYEINSSKLLEANAIIIPGVGSYDAAAKKINLVRNFLLDAISKEIPILGICLGYQLLLESSEEGKEKGLGIFKGKAVKFSGVKVPHIGWNTLENLKEDKITEGIKENSYVYFVHSYYPLLEEDIALAKTTYGVSFASIAKKKTVYGFQFHPEKSGTVGLKLLENFLRLSK